MRIFNVHGGNIDLQFLRFSSVLQMATRWHQSSTVFLWAVCGAERKRERGESGMTSDFLHRNNIWGFHVSTSPFWENCRKQMCNVFNFQCLDFLTFHKVIAKKPIWPLCFILRHVYGLHKQHNIFKLVVYSPFAKMFACQDYIVNVVKYAGLGLPKSKRGETPLSANINIFMRSFWH